MAGASVLTYVFIGMMVVFMVSAIAFEYQQYVQERSLATREEAEIVTAQRGTTVILTVTRYDEAEDDALVEAENTGKTSISLSDVDFILDDVFVPREPGSRTLTLPVDHDDDGVWDKGDILLARINRTLDDGTYGVVLLTPYGVFPGDLTVGDDVSETLYVAAGTWSPADPGDPLNSTELLAIDNDGGTAIALVGMDPLGNDAGCAMTDLDGSMGQHRSTRILVDYDAPAIAPASLVVEARNVSFAGPLFCGAAFGPTAGEATAAVDCPAADTQEETDNLYIYIILSDPSDVTLDFVRAEINYTE
ncbi:hypothetical protein JXB02_05790 [Candidatus Woesearchaeota archaeon]|nr:hypothetical protein [Candidatus Woesearchaeota archaeon]